MQASCCTLALGEKTPRAALGRQHVGNEKTEAKLIYEEAKFALSNITIWSIFCFTGKPNVLIGWGIKKSESVPLIGTDSLFCVAL